MANNIWISTTGVWDDTTSWSLGSIPDSTDEVLFDGTVQQSVDVPPVEAGQNTITSFTVMEGYGGSFGSPGNLFRLNIADTDPKVTYEGTGDFFCHIVSSASIVFIIRTPGRVELSGTGTQSITPALIILKGRVHMYSTINYTCYVSYDTNPSTDSELTIEPSASTLSNLYQNAGRVINSRTTFACTVAGGEYIQTVSGGAIGSMKIRSGSVDLRNIDVGATPFLSECDLYSGQLDLSNNRILKTMDRLHVWQDGNIIPDDYTDFVTVTTTRKIASTNG